MCSDRLVQIDPQHAYADALMLLAKDKAADDAKHITALEGSVQQLLEEKRTTPRDKSDKGKEKSDKGGKGKEKSKRGARDFSDPVGGPSGWMERMAALLCAVPVVVAYYD